MEDKENLSGLQNIFDRLYKEAEAEYNRMPHEYRKRISLSTHTENYIREKANKSLKEE